MRNFILVAILTVSILSCKENKNSDATHKITSIKSLTPGPIIHESLNEEQLDKIKIIYETFIEVNPTSLEETITNFKRDQNPDNEINIWLNMAKAFQPFALKNKGDEKIDHRNEAFILILMRSMMPEDQAIKTAELRVLSKNEIQEILKSYTLEANPLKIME